MKKSNFRLALEAAINERHCADHPMWDKLSAGELSRNACMGWAVEHYHWISNMLTEATFQICSKAPPDVIELELENFSEEEDPDDPHMEIVLQFAEANGADIDAVRTSEGLPTTRSWADWLKKIAKEEDWYCGIAAIRIGTESQSPRLYSRVLPSLREIYKYDEDAIKHFWLHSEVDIEHSNRGFELLERHCKTPAMKEMAIHFARESARMRWFYFDGIYLHYEQGYALQ
ncbi:MAG: iron-containing redox enzyme family protein [Pseudomonadota bacterium]|nr:iron-containing redox enzyme family protein [Pseudomonadota bacterium]